jgi:endonuclease YncB( thermonuclease family)
MLRTLSLALPLFAVLSPAARSQTTWTIDDDGPADFPEISAAVAAASDGDTLLVRAGAYLPITIAG